MQARTVRRLPSFVLVLCLLLFFFAIACGATSKPNRAKASEPDPAQMPGGGLAPLGAASSSNAPANPSRSPTPGCIVVQGEFGGQPTTVDGELSIAPKSADGKVAVAPLLLRLTQPRCLVGVPRMNFITEIYVASANADLRPLVGQRIQITGDAVGGTNDLGGPAVVILAKDVARAGAIPADGP
jgi:hypothetical protein